MPNHRIALIALAALLCGGCATTTPVAEVQQVSQAFQDLNAASAPLLDDMAVAERIQGKTNAGFRANKHATGATLSAATDRCTNVSELAVGGVAVQDGFCTEDSPYYSELVDPPVTASFRRGLRAVESYTNVLLILAEGRNIEVAQAEVQTLAANVGGVAALAGATTVGPALTTLSNALKPVLDIAAKRANTKELARVVKDVAPLTHDVVEKLHVAAPELFTTLTERSMERLRARPSPPAEIVAAEARRIEAYRVAASNYVVLLGRYQQLLDTLVKSYDAGGKVITLTGLVQRSAELSAQADAWRRTYSALRMGF